MSAFLEVEYDRKANEQTTAYRCLCWQCRTRWVSISTSVERRPSRRSKAALQHIRWVSVTVAYEHRLQECISDDASDRRSDGSNLAAVATADDDTRRYGLAAHSVGSQQVLASCTCEGREGCGRIDYDEVKVCARYGSVNELHRTALAEHLL